MSLFPPDRPDGFHYRDDFLSPDDEQALARAVDEIAFDTFSLRGVVARRRVKFYGAAYDERPSLPMPPFLLGLRERVAAWAQVPAAAFAMALINEYTPGATIGWHRDAPQYDITAGVSLLSACRMKLRPYVAPRDHAARRPTAPARPPAGGRAPMRKTTHVIDLAPRSAYLMTGLARAGYEHSIAPTASLRYSITFRSLR